MKFKPLALMLMLAMILTNCTQLGLTKEEDDDTTTGLFLLLAAAALTSNPCNTSATAGTVGANSTLTLSGGCVNGVTNSMDSSLPSWIKNNFKCSAGYTVTSGSTSYYCFKSKNLLNAHSYYYGSSSSLFKAFNKTTTPTNSTLSHSGYNNNPNTTASQNLVYAIPANPTPKSGTLTGTQAGLVSIGIAVNGLAIFNNAAAAPDTLSTEAATFDDQEGHPQNTGLYHHHSQLINGDNTGGTPNSVNLTEQGSSALVGVALDGYAIYGKFCGSATTGQNAVATGLDSNHGHTTTTPEFSTATYHYHYGGTTGGGNDATAGIPTIMGSYFYGVVGQVSN